jgi:hypothetical protein
MESQSAHSPATKAAKLSTMDGIPILVGERIFNNVVNVVDCR